MECDWGGEKERRRVVAARFIGAKGGRSSRPDEARKFQPPNRVYPGRSMPLEEVSGTCLENGPTIGEALKRLQRNELHSLSSLERFPTNPNKSFHRNHSGNPRTLRQKIDRVTRMHSENHGLITIERRKE